MSKKHIELSKETLKAKAILEQRLANIAGRPVAVEIKKPTIEIDAFIHSIELRIKFGSYQHVTMLRMDELDIDLYVHRTFDTVYQNFVYSFIKELAQRY